MSFHVLNIKMFLAVVDMQHSFHVLIMACEHLSVFFVWFPLSQHSLAIAYVYFFTTFTQTNYTRVSGDCTRVSHKTNTSACRNSTVSPKLSRVTSSSRWTWARGPLALHSWSKTTLTHKMAFLGISMHLFQKKYYQHVRNAVLAVCAKSVPVWSKRREMRGLLWGEKLSWHVLYYAFTPKQGQDFQVLEPGSPKPDLQVHTRRLLIYRVFQKMYPILKINVDKTIILMSHFIIS